MWAAFTSHDTSQTFSTLSLCLNTGAGSCEGLVNQTLPGLLAGCAAPPQQRTGIWQTISQLGKVNTSVGSLIHLLSCFRRFLPAVALPLATWAQTPGKNMTWLNSTSWTHLNAPLNKWQLKEMLGFGQTSPALQWRTLPRNPDSGGSSS